jgi:hypothetical protein
MPRNPYVTIGEAARIAGVSVDTLRRLDDAGVYRDTIRTGGSHRRFSVEELERVRDGDQEPTADPPPVPRAELSHTRMVHPWEARAAEAETDLTVTRLCNERRDEERRFREAEKAREARAVTQSELQAAQARERQAANMQRARDQRELDHCLSLLRMGYGFERPAVKVEIEKFLADHARPGVSIEWIEAKVAAIRERHAEEQRERQQRDAREREEIDRKAQAESDAKWRQEWKEFEDGQRKNSLVAHGERIAMRDTTGSDWDDDAGAEARAEVKAELEAEVEADWTERDVEELVQEVLEEWEP